MLGEESLSKGVVETLMTSLVGQTFGSPGEPVSKESMGHTLDCLSPGLGGRGHRFLTLNRSLTRH